MKALFVPTLFFVSAVFADAPIEHPFTARLKNNVISSPRVVINGGKYRVPYEARYGQLLCRAYGLGDLERFESGRFKVRIMSFEVNDELEVTSFARVYPTVLKSQPTYIRKVHCREN